MSRVFFISDLHFGHESMSIKRGFSSVEDHDNFIIENWNKVVHKKDTVYILGDISMERYQPYENLGKLNGVKKVVLGNHDKSSHIHYLLEYVNSVCGMYKYKGCILSHAPIHTDEIEFFRYNIHGHIHEKTIDHPKYINVSCEAINYTPVPFDKLVPSI